MSTQLFQIKNQDNEKLVGVLHLPKKKTDKIVVICHGLRATKDKPWTVEACEMLSISGYAVLRFDFSGNGESEGKFEEMSYSKQVGELKSVNKSLKKHGFTKIATIGHSMGGGVVVLEASLDRSVKLLISLAGVMHPLQHEVYLRELCRKFNLNCESITSDLNSINMIESAKKLSIPVIAIHGDNDPRVPIFESNDLLAAVKGKKELVILNGVDHLFTDDIMKTKVVDAIVTVVKKYF